MSRGNRPQSSWTTWLAPAMCALAFGTSGCRQLAEPATSPEGNEPTARGASPDEPTTRRPPGIVLDRQSSLPEPAQQAAPGSALTVLQSPPSAGAARALVGHFFQAVVAEDAEELSRLLTSNAAHASPQSPPISMGVHQGSGQVSARSVWQQRLAELDYQALALQLVYDASSLAAYHTEDARALRARRKLPLVPAADEVLVHVSILASKHGRVRLFGDEMWLLVTTEGGQPKIRSIIEDFQNP